MIRLRSNIMKIVFISDLSVKRTGFKAYYQIRKGTATVAYGEGVEEGREGRDGCPLKVLEQALFLSCKTNCREGVGHPISSPLREGPGDEVVGHRHDIFPVFLRSTRQEMYSR